MTSYTDSVGILVKDDRIPEEEREVLFEHHIMGVTIYRDNKHNEICNIYILQDIYNEIHNLMRFKGLNKEEAEVEATKKLIMHEEMHKCLYKTIGYESAYKYDILLGGEHTNELSWSTSTINEDEILP